MKNNLDIVEWEILKKTEGIALREIKISSRLYHILRRIGCVTLTDLMALDVDEASSVRNFGTTSRKELSQIKEFIYVSDRNEILNTLINPINNSNNYDSARVGWTVLDVALNKKRALLKITFWDEKGNHYENIDLQDTDLHDGLKKKLDRYNLNSLLDIARYPYSELISIKEFDEESINEIKNLLKKRVSTYAGNKKFEKNIEEIITIVEDYYKDLLDGLTFVDIKAELIETIIVQYGVDVDVETFDEEKILSLAYSNPIKRLIEQRIMKFIPEKFYFEMSESSLVRNIVSLNSPIKNIISEYIKAMIDSQLIRLNDGNLCRYKVFLDEWICTLEGNSKIAIESRLQGLTLEETGAKLGVTRERARQIIDKALRRRPQFYEDDYAYFIEKYIFSKEKFCKIFDLTNTQINYLFLVYKNGSKDIQEFLLDNNIPEKIKEKAVTVFKDEVVILDGESIPLKRELLLQKLLSLYYADCDCTVDEFIEFYMGFLKRNNIDQNESLLFPNKRAIEARLVEYPFTIAKIGHKIRYYETLDVDINDLLEKINIGQYNNKEISTLKVIKDYPEIMEEFDIRDEYELHNLIRKKVCEIKGYDISVTRMPMIKIGTASRERQVEELLAQMAPISNIDLAHEYEELYGVRTETVLANFFKCIDVFFHNGVYTIDQQDLTDEEYKKMRLALKEDVYLWDDIVEIYNNTIKEPRQNAINPMSLKKLGFRVYSQYVISNNYLSADSFFSSKLLEKEIIDLKNFPDGIKSLKSFISTFTKLRDSLDLIEINKDVYCRYDRFTILFDIDSKNKLVEIGAKMLNEMTENEYSSVNMLINQNKIIDYPEITKNQYVLNSIFRIQPGFKTGWIGGAYIVTRKNNDLSQLAVISHLIKKYGGMRIASLIERMHSEYGIILHKSRILYIINKSNEIVYDEIFDYICPCFEWTGYNGPVYIQNTRFSDVIIRNQKKIDDSNVLISKVFWKDKYSEFVKYCFANGLFKMKDILELDFKKVYDNAKELNISCETVSEIASLFLEWVNNLSVETVNEKDIDILNLFFK